MSTGWTVLKDGKQVAPVVFSVEEPAWTWLLKHQPQSTDWAIKHEGYSIEQVDREHSDRAKYVTEQVKLWLSNDHTLVGMTVAAYADRGEYALWQFVTGVLQRAKPGSDAWHVAQELAPNDYPRIRWDDVAHEISDMEV